MYFGKAIDNCKFCCSWLTNEDTNGRKMNKCCRIGDEGFSLYCKKRRKNLSCCKGFYTLNQHALPDEYMKWFAILLSLLLLWLYGSARQQHQLANYGSQTLYMFCDKYAAYKLELIWVLKSLQSYICAALCNGIIDVFEAMFPDKLPPRMLVSVRKAMYLISTSPTL